MREIKLTNSNDVALVDDDDFDNIFRFKWRVSHKHGTGKFKY